MTFPLWPLTGHASHVQLLRIAICQCVSSPVYFGSEQRLCGVLALKRFFGADFCIKNEEKIWS